MKAYACNSRVNGTADHQLTLAHDDGTQYRKRQSPDLQEPKREAELAAANLANGEDEVLRLTSVGRTNCLQTPDTSRPLGRQLNLAAAECAAMLKLLPQDVSRCGAVTDLARSANTVRGFRNGPELVAEYIAATE